MLRSLLERVRGRAEEDPAGDQHLVALAAATLLMEVAWADHHIAEEEMAVVRSALVRQLGLDPEEAGEIIEASRREHDRSVGLHAFTRTLVEAWDEQQRYELLVALWRLAFSDAALDRFEEHTIRRISELLYVSHARFIQAKRLARDAEKPGTP